MERQVIVASITEACNKLRVGRATVYRWLDQNLIAAVQEPGGRWRIFLLLVRSNGSTEAFTLPRSALPDLLGEYSHLLTKEG